jgi:hypothetical protein
MNKDTRPRNDKKQAHGLWEYYYNDGELWYNFFYQNDKRVGYGETFNGNLYKKKYNL